MECVNAVFYSFELEAVWAELLLPRSKGILVCSCYRPPTDGNFLTRLEESLAKVEPGTELFILGDLNIDFKNSETSLYKSLTGLLDLNGLSQIIDEPTRITPTSSSILDHVIVSMKEKIKGSGVIGVGFSDHLITFCSRGFLSDKTQLNTRKIRMLRDYTPSRFVEALKGLDWTALLTSTDVNFCLSEFTRLLGSALDIVAPLRDVRVKVRSSPWINSHILSGIKLRDTLLKRFRRDPSNRSVYSEYCKVRNSVQRDVKLAKETFFSNSIEKSKGNSSKLWRHLSSLGYKSSSSSSKESFLFSMCFEF